MEQCIKIYRKVPSRKGPFEKWFDGLKSEEAQALVQKHLSKLARGLRGSVKPLKKGLKEVRIPDSGGLRIYFAEIEKNTILLLNGGSKNTKKEQNEDIKAARSYLEDFLK